MDIDIICILQQNTGTIVNVLCSCYYNASKLEIP